MADFYGSYPPEGGSGGVPTYATFASFPSASSAGSGALALALDTDLLYASNGVSWVIIGGPGVPVSVGAFDSGTPSVQGAHIDSDALIMQSASGSVPGLVNTTTQTLAGAKTFSSAPVLSSLTASLPLQLDASKNVVAAATVLSGAQVSGILTVDKGGTGLASGTSGGILGYTASGVLASSGVLTVDQLIVGGGAGATPKVLAAGTNTNVLTMVAGIPAWAAPATSGTVTSVAMTVPSFLSVSGSPITSSGTLAVSLSGTALPLANGGTGQTTKAAAFDALSPLLTAGSIIYGGVSGTGTSLAAGSSTQVLHGGTTPSWGAVNLALGADVTGTLPVGNGGTGTTSATGSGATVRQTNATLITPILGTPQSIDLTNATNVPVANATGILPVANGGTGIASGTSGGILGYTASGVLASSSALTVSQLIVGGGAGATPATLAAGTNTNVLTMVAGIPAWAAPATSGTVTSVAMTVPTFLSVSGSPVTSSGTLAVTLSGTALPAANGGTGVVSTATFPTSGVVVTEAATETLTNKTFTDNVTFFQDDGDNTKKMQFDLSQIGTGTTKTLTVPNSNMTLVGATATQTLTNKTLTDSTTFIADDGDNTKKAQFQCSGISAGTTRTFTFPDASTTLVGNDAAQTLTFKTMDGGSNTFTNLPASGLSGAVPVANGGTGQVTASAGFNALSPMTTAGDIIYGGAAGTGTRLAKGTANQVLHSGTTPSYSAVDLAADVTGTLPLLNGGTGTAAASANAAFNALSPLTTKGDVATYSTVNARLAVGTDGQVLSSDSTATTGLKWVAAATSALNQYTVDVGDSTNTRTAANTNLVGDIKASIISAASVSFTNATPTVVTWTSHGLVLADKVYFTAAVMPTGVSASTTYYVIPIDANTFNIATTFANAVAATKVAASSTGTTVVGYSGGFQRLVSSSTLAPANATSATSQGQMQYLHGTTYNDIASSGVNSPTITLSSGGGTLSSVQRGLCVPYLMADGVTWRMRYQFAVTVSSTARTSAVFAIAGILAKNVSNFYQTVTGMPTSAVANNSYWTFNSNLLNIDHASNTYTTYYSSGDIELNAKPNWAY